MRSAREAAARGARAAKGLDTRSLIVGACLTLVAASLGYAARGPGGSTNGSGTASAGAAGTSGSSGGAGTGTGASGAASGLSTGSTDLTGQAVGGSSSSGGAFSEGSGGAAPASSAAGGGSGSGGTSGTVAPNTPLTASDQGITPKTIKLGFLIANTSNLAAAGFNVGVNGDQGKVITAWFNELNRNGGIDGRQLTNYNYTFDVLDTNDMTAGCKTMTQDQKVFSVITTGGYDSTAQLCIAKENKTPLISTDPEPASWYPQSAPYLWATFMNKDRLFLNQAKWLASSGYVRSTDKVGVIYHDIPNVAPSVTGTLLPALARNGIHPTDVVKLASDSNQALAQIQNAVLDMRTKGVTFVIFDMNLIFKTQFMQYAQNQQWFPRYTDTDEYFGCEDFVTTTYPPQAFNGTECLGTTLAGINPQHYPVTAFTKYADQVYDRTYPQGYSTNGSSEMSQQEQQLTNYELGSEILLWANAAKRAGPNPTRAQWGLQMGKTGAWSEQVGYCSASFGPAKWDGSDELSVDQYHAEASGGWQADKFHQLAPGCFKNWF